MAGNPVDRRPEQKLLYWLHARAACLRRTHAKRSDTPPGFIFID